MNVDTILQSLLISNNSFSLRRCKDCTNRPECRWLPANFSCDHYGSNLTVGLC